MAQYYITPRLGLRLVWHVVHASPPPPIGGGHCDRHENRSPGKRRRRRIKHGGSVHENGRRRSKDGHEPDRRRRNRRLSILRDDAVDFRTHSFQDGFFRLSLVGALEMSTDQRADREEVKDVQYTHVAQVQQLQSAFPIALTDQPSNLHCFQLEFPLDDDNTSPKTSVLARGNPDPDSNEPRRITLAAHSAEERDKWLGALNLFCKLTAAERARASRSAAFQKQLRKKAREEKLDDMEIGHALASTADPTPHVPKTTTTSKCLFPAQLAQATDVQDVVPNQDGIPVFEEASLAECWSSLSK